MKYKPITGVWEITMGCNMRCKHCGSICENPQSDELTTKEALNLCEELGKLGFKHITLSGGEPTTREDWHVIAKGLRDNGIIPTMITNGWLIDEKIIDKAIEAGVNTIAISIDGLEETHDFMRKAGSFQRSIKALKLMGDKGIYSAVITTVNKKNINQLENMKNVFIESGVTTWQLQIGMPMGNLKENCELVLDNDGIDTIIDFGYKNLNDNKIKVHFADCIGYYNRKEMEVRKASSNSDYMWQGCGAGKHSLGILCNGDIVGCTSIRNKEFIEGNIRKTSLKHIWTSPETFKWNREIIKEKIDGFCSKCNYGDVCLGGCSNTRLCMEDSIYKENKYCSYYIAMNRKKEEIKVINDADNLFKNAEKLAKIGQFQLAELLLERALHLEQENIKFLNLYAYVNFMLKNYTIAKNINEKILEINHDDIYANKGLGLTLCKLGEVEKGIQYLKNAVKLTDYNYMEPYHDCAATLMEHDKIEEARSILEEARHISFDFVKANKELYDKLNISAIAEEED